MYDIKDFIQKQYSGYVNTSQLQFTGTDLPYSPFIWATKDVPNQVMPRHMENYVRLRLGRQMEELFIEGIRRGKTYRILSHSMQAVKNKQTIGELDCILKRVSDGVYIHLELAIKFYLYDPHLSLNPLENYIGPMRRDTLVEKLDKFKEKQFPLLYHPVIQERLLALDVQPEQIIQQHLLKAQLFLPLAMNVHAPGFSGVNAAGYYCTFSELLKNEVHDTKLKHSMFHIPSKKAWIINPHPAVGWISYSEAVDYVQAKHNENYTPMLWRKEKDGSIQKFFCVSDDWSQLG